MANEFLTVKPGEELAPNLPQIDLPQVPSAPEARTPLRLVVTPRPKGQAVDFSDFESLPGAVNAPAKRPPGGLLDFDALPDAAAATPPAAEIPPAAVRPEMPGILEATMEGLKAGTKQVGQGYEALTGGQPQAEGIESQAAEPFNWNDLLSPISSGAPKVAYRMASGYPALAGGVIGGAGLGAAGAATGPAAPFLAPAGALAGGALGSAVVSAVQTLGPEFAQELAAHPGDPDGSYARAMHKAQLSGAFAGASWALFPARLFQGPVKQMLFQAFGVQPGLAVTHKALENVLDEKPLTEDIGQSFVEGAVGTAAPAAGHMAVKAALKPLAAKPVPPLPQEVQDHIKFLRERADALDDAADKAASTPQEKADWINAAGQLRDQAQGIETRQIPPPPLGPGSATPNGPGGGGAPPGGAGTPGAPPPPNNRGVLPRITTADREGRWSYNFDDLYTRVKDDLHPINAWKSEIAHDLNTNLDAINDPYKLARLTRGSAGKAQQMLENSTFRFNDLQNNGASLREILEPVRNDLNGIREYMVSRRAIELNERGIRTGVPLDDAREAVRQGGRYAPVFDQLVQFQRRTLDYLRDSGIISGEAYDRMVEANKDYVPFFRLMDEQTREGTGGPGGGLKVRQPVRGIRGSERLIIDPLESIIKNTYLFTALAERNRVLNSMRELAERHPNGQEFMEPVRRPVRPIRVTEQETARFMQEHGIQGTPDEFTIFRPQAFRPGPDEVALFQNGQRRVYRVDPEVANAVNALDRESMGIITRILAVPAKTLRAGAIFSPEFIARNPIRDQFSAFAFSRNGYIPVYDFVRGLGSMFRQDAHYQNWLKSGGANVAMASLDRAYLRDVMARLIDRNAFHDLTDTLRDPGASALQKTWAGTRIPFRAADRFILNPLRVLSEASENATRIGEFRRAMGRGRDAFEAGFDTREVTLDFQRVGSQMRTMNQITAFFNPQVEGVDRAARAFKDRPLSTAFKVAASITAPSVGLWAVNHNDPRWKALPQWERDLFWMVMTDDWKNVSPEDAGNVPDGYKRQGPDGQWQQNFGTVYRVPKPFELGVLFGSVPERILDAYYAEDPNAFRNLSKSVSQAFLPNLIPTAAVPVVEHFANRSTFTDRTLVPDRLKDLVPKYQTNPYTTKTAEFLGKLISKADDKTTFGSPIVVENYIRAWSGALGMYALKANDAALKATGIAPTEIEPTWTKADYPILRAFVARHPSASAQQVQDFYDTYNERKKVISTVKYLSKQGEADAAQEESGNVLENAERVHKALGNQLKFVRDIWRRKDMSPDDKRKVIDQTYLQMIEVAEEGNRLFRETKAAADADKKKAK